MENPESEIVFLLSSGELIVENSNAVIEGALHYSHRSLEEEVDKEGNKLGRRKIKAVRTALFTVIEGQDKVRRIITYQGFIDRLVQLCQKTGYRHRVIDMREPMPGPKIKFAKGFRFGQQRMFLTLLRANRSGILKAPTRYGKTTLIVNTLRVYPGIKTIVTAPEKDLLGQLAAELRLALPDRQVGCVFSGAKGLKENDDITVVSMDSLGKIDHDSVRLVLIDEPHRAAAPVTSMALGKFKRARIIGFGATVTGRFDGADKIIEGLIGPVLVEKSFQEAVAEGAICPIRVYMVKIKFDEFKAWDRHAAYKKLLFDNPKVHQVVKRLHKDIIPADWQTLMFIAEGKQGALLQKHLEDAETSIPLSVASKMKPKERRARYAEMSSGAMKRCLATSIYATGITFPYLRAVINVAGGGGSITGTQKPGRLAQCRPELGKKRGYMIDFLFECVQTPKTALLPGMEETLGEKPKLGLLAAREHIEKEKVGERPHWDAVVKESHTRMKTYLSLGYDVKVVTRGEEIVLD